MQERQFVHALFGIICVWKELYSLVVHACDLVKKFFSSFWVHLGGGNSNNADNWMVE